MLAIETAYRQGYLQNELGANPHGNRVTAVMNLRETREAVRNWRAAASDHGHASYWGREHIRMMRAYWLGAFRGKVHARLFDADCKRMARLGEEYGRAAATWILDGNSSTADARGVLAAIEDCELEIPNPLSGEWAGDPTPRDLFSEADVSYPDTADDETELLDAFDDAYSEGFQMQAEKEARAFLGLLSDDGRKVGA